MLSSYELFLFGVKIGYCLFGANFGATPAKFNTIERVDNQGEFIPFFKHAVLTEIHTGIAVNT
jgi:hypothetical protein